MILVPFFSASHSHAAADYSKGLLDGKPINFLDYRSGAVMGTTNVVTDGNLDNYVLLSPNILGYTFPGAVDAQYLKVRYRVDGGADNDLIVFIYYADGSNNMFRLYGNAITDGVVKLAKPIKSFRLSKSNGFNRYVYELNVFGTPDTTPPAVPTGFTGTAGDSTVTLSFDRNTETDFSHYVLYTDGVPRKYLDAEVDLEKNNSRKILLNGLKNGTKYTFYLTAVDADVNESARAGPIILTPRLPDTIPPAVPTLSGQAGNESVELQWTPGKEDDLAGYMIYQNGTTLRKLGVDNRLKITRLQNNKIYSYEVSAFDTSGNESARSNMVSVTPKNPVTETEQEAKDGYLLVTWTETEGATGYKIYLNGRLIDTVGPGVREYRITRAMGYNPANLVNKGEARAIFKDGSEGGSSNPNTPPGGGFLDNPLSFIGIPEMLKTSISFLMMYAPFILIALAVVFSPVLYELLVRLIAWLSKKNLKGS
ncbi:hypothetical protein MKY98_26995 [Paenibacillus sp. FSL M8-0228]|uniref:fibronectin type III domain-containing protein n=1 Tax=Paenibacillus sp. FSL M8-0228 TaxID=2921620 RepID=UPI0030FB1BA5